MKNSPTYGKSPEEDGFSQKKKKIMRLLNITSKERKATKRFRKQKKPYPAIEELYRLHQVHHDNSSFLLKQTFIHLDKFTYPFGYFFREVTSLKESDLQILMLIQQLLFKISAEIHAHIFFEKHPHESWPRIKAEIKWFRENISKNSQSFDSFDIKSNKYKIELNKDSVCDIIQQVKTGSALKTIKLLVFKQECLADKHISIEKAFENRRIAMLLGLSPGALSQHKEKVFKACNEVLDGDNDPKITIEQIACWFLKASQEDLKFIANKMLSTPPSSEELTPYKLLDLLAKKTKRRIN